LQTPFELRLKENTDHLITPAMIATTIVTQLAALFHWIEIASTNARHHARVLVAVTGGSTPSEGACKRWPRS
jgi:hypothetical protein